MKLANTILAACTALLGGYVLYACRGFPATVDNTPGPGLWPRILAVCLLIASAVLLAQTLLRRPPTAEGAEGDAHALFRSKPVLRAYLMIGMALAYAALMAVVGFVVSTMLFLPAAILYMGETSWKLSAVIGVVSSLAIYGLFYGVFHVPLPVGMLFV